MTVATLTPPTLGYGDLSPLIRLMSGDEKHEPSAHSTLDVLWVLYDRILDVAPDRAHDPARDRFVLSKGHGPMAYFAILAAKGFLPVDTLETFTDAGSPLGTHPDRLLIPGVEASSGSLGHGLPLSIGMALG
ncbi:MAG: transketolase, partial [Nocardioidaceae bacterium]